MNKVGAFFKKTGKSIAGVAKKCAKAIAANKVKSIIIGSVAALVIGGATTGIILATRNPDPTPIADSNENSTKKVPIYQGMTITTVDVVSAKLYSSGKDGFDYEKDNGNHNGHFKGDHTGKDAEIDELNPFPENDADETIEEEVKSSLSVDGSRDEIYYAKPGENIYINIHILNPDDFEIMSFTLNGKKYSSYMFEDGSDMETIVIKYNVGDVSGIVNYTIDAIKYIDGEDIKDVIIDGDKTVTAGIKTNGQVKTEVTDLSIDINSIAFKVKISDKDSLINPENASLKAVIYNGESIIAEKALVVGDNTVSFTNLDVNTLYQYAIVGCYDDLSGTGFGLNVLYKDVFSTEALVLFDNVVISQNGLSFAFSKNAEYPDTAITSIKLYKSGTFIQDIPKDATKISGLLSNNVYTLVAEYENGEKTENISLNFITAAKATPEISIINTSKGKDSLGFSVIVTDTDTLGAISKIELIHGTDVKLLENALTLETDNLLSDNDYMLRVTYTYDMNDGEGARVIVKELSARTVAKEEPTFALNTPTKTQNSISFSINETDADEVGVVTKVELIHADGVITADAPTQRTFSGLLSNYTYTLRVTYAYDLNDGKGSHEIVKTAEVKTDAKTAPNVTFDAVIPGSSIIYFGVNEVDIDNVGEITKIELLLNGELVHATTDGSVRNFSGLYSDTTYTLRLTYKYNLGDGSEDVTITRTETVKTTESNVPTIILAAGTQTHTSVGFAIEESDTSNVGNVTKIELYLGSTLIKTAEDTTVRSFPGLLSDTEYTVKVTYVYDLNDGSASVTETREIKIKTSRAAMPSVTFESTDRTKTSVSFTLNIVDVNNVGYIYSIELLKGGEVVRRTQNTTDREFRDILSDTTYVVRVTYAYNLNKGAGVEYITKTAEIKTYPKVVPEFSLLSPTKTQTGVGFSTTETDTDNTGDISKIELYRGNTLVKTAESNTSRAFADLLSGTAYRIVVTYTYNLNDGTGNKNITRELEVATIAKATPTVTVTNSAKGQTTLNFSVAVTDTDSVGSITKIEIVHGTDVTELENANTHALTNLLSNNEYTLRVTYTYNLNDGAGERTLVRELTARTSAKATPEITISNTEKTQTSLNFSVVSTDTDSVGSITKIEVVHGTDVTELENANTHALTNLLSNNEYTLRVTYTYNLNDGAGERTLVRELTARTSAKATPSFAVKNEDIETGSINAEYDVTDVDNVLASYKVELYKDGSLVEENAEKKISFSSLSTYTEYTVRITYSYDLNDGNGVQTATYNYTFKTMPYIDVTECEIANTGAVSEGNTIYMEVKLNNPHSMSIESVVINGESYSVTGASTKNKIFVEIVYNGQFAGGDTYLKIDKINAKIDDTLLSVEPESELSDNVFINGKVEVVSIEYVDENFELFEDGSWLLHSETVYELVTLDNPTGYVIDSLSDYTKLDNNRYYREATWSGWSTTLSISSVSYHNEYITNLLVIETVYSSNINLYKLSSDEIKYISTPDDLKNMYNGYYYELTGDIDLDGIEWPGGGSFNGVLNGKGYSIKNMSFVGDVENAIGVHLGLFSYGSGIIQNLKIEEATVIANITSIDDRVCKVYYGGLVAYASGHLYISGCEVDEYTSVSIKNSTRGSSYVGGLVGYTGSGINIKNSYNKGNVSANVSTSSQSGATLYTAFAGGLIGFVCDSTIIENSYNTGSVAASIDDGSYPGTYSGGLVGHGLSGMYGGATITITDSYNNGDVSGSRAAGLVGTSGWDTSITNSYNSGSITATTTSTSTSWGASASASGLGGTTITNSYNTGKVTANAPYGSSASAEGLGGTTIISSYNIGDVTAYGNGSASAEGLGGSTITNSYNTGKVTASGSNSAYASGLGGTTITNSYNTGDVSGSYYVGGLVGYAHQNITITNSYNTGDVSGSYYVGGLVGYCNSSSTVTIIGSYNNGNINGGSTSGGLVGYAHQNITITNSYNTGDVSGSYYVGGLVGYCNSSSTVTIIGSHNNGNVIATPESQISNVSVGGLVGWGGYSTIIENSYNTGNVNVTVTYSIYTGGLIGRGHSTITNSYNTGDINVTSSKISYTGGLIGCGEVYALTITNSYNAGNVTVTSTSSESSYAGGLSGYCAHTITKSYNTGNITVISNASAYIGGLAPWCIESIINSYSLVQGNGYNGDACTVEQLDSKDFYTDTLGWSEDVWDLSELDIENGKHPKIKQKS